MGRDLDVDTERIRRAAGLLRVAAEAMPGQPAVPVPAGIDEHAAGSSAEGRQALRLAVARTRQGIDAAGDLAAFAEHLAALLCNAAAMFERAEAASGAGG